LHRMSAPGRSPRRSRVRNSSASLVLSFGGPARLLGSRPTFSMRVRPGENRPIEALQKTRRGYHAGVARANTTLVILRDTRGRPPLSARLWSTSSGTEEAAGRPSGSGSADTTIGTAGPPTCWLGSDWHGNVNCGS